MTISKQMNYNGGTSTKPSSIDKARNAGQLNTFYWLRKALITARKEQFFGQLASTIGMPKHYGKEIKILEYVPLLDDRNKNDQGIDASGAYYANGNLYGSSKDVGVIGGAMPLLTEFGGRVNRVGFTRMERKGSIRKLGFFTEFTQESLDFDSDDQLMEHISREMMNGAVQMSEAFLQRDLLQAAGTILYAGGATNDGEVSADDTGSKKAAVITYDSLRMLDRMLTERRCPKQTTIITGSRMVDTKTIPACRVAFTSANVRMHLETLRDSYNNPAWIPLHQYAEAGKSLNGEVGQVGGFRVVEVPEMQVAMGKGAAVGANQVKFDNDGSKYTIHHFLVVGDDSFTNIGFQMNGNNAKFKVITRMPGDAQASREDPYGESGFSSIKWYDGFLAKRPERIALLKCVAPK